MAQNDARDDAYVEWESLTHREQMVFCTAAMDGAAYAIQDAERRYPGLRELGLEEVLPYFMTNTQMVQLIDMVYADERRRLVPYIAVIMDPLRFYEIVGVRSINGK